MRIAFLATLVTLCWIFGSTNARAAGGAAAPAGDGMRLAEELLLQEDLEQVPAKEETLEQKKRASEETETREALLLGGEETNMDAGEAAAGSLEYDMDTVDMLADAPAMPIEQEPSIAKP